MREGGNKIEKEEGWESWTGEERREKGRDWQIIKKKEEKQTDRETETYTQRQKDRDRQAEKE